MSARVFVVEDEALIAMELVDRLQELGYVVCGRALRGDQALERIPAAEPDLILMDINLGPGPSGIEVAERLRASSDVPVLFLTAYSDPSSRSARPRPVRSASSSSRSSRMPCGRTSRWRSPCGSPTGRSARARRASGT